MPKRFQAQTSFSDMFMPVDAAAEWLFAVVQMPGPDPIDADRTIKFVHRRGILVRRLQRVTGREDMAGINTNTQPHGVANLLQNRSDLFETMSQVGPLPRGRFQP